MIVLPQVFVLLLLLSFMVNCNRYLGADSENATNDGVRD